MPTHNSDISALSLTQLMEITGKSYPTLKKHLARLEPVRVDGRTKYYDATQAINAIYSTVSPAEEKARLDRLRADKVELELEEMRGKLVHVDKISTHWANVANLIRTRMLAVPTKAAPLVKGAGTLAEIKETLEVLIHDALTELSSTPPGVVAGDSGSDGAQASAASDSESVGRRKQEAKRGKRGRARKVAN